MNKNPSLSEREFEILNVIAKGISTNQRALSAETGMSLGLTNLVLKRLVTKGILKARQLNRRKLEYLLTARGFSEKAKKSYRYTVKTIDSIVLLRHWLKDILQSKVREGYKEFVLVGDGDLEDLVELSFRGMSEGVSFKRTATLTDFKLGTNALVLSAAKQSVHDGDIKHLNILEQLSSAMFQNKKASGN